MGLTKATIKNCDTGEVFTCLFNPTEYTISKSNDWAKGREQGRDASKISFGGGAPQSLTLELFFDTYEQKKDVRDHTRKLIDLTLTAENTENKTTQQGRPPLCIFQWGTNWEFKGAVTQLSVRYTLFQMDGTPVRATANLTLIQAEDEKRQPRTNPTSGTDRPVKRRVVRPQDSLPLIAYQEYGDSNFWRLIADENGLDDPMSLPDGLVLAIPSLN